MYGSLHLRASMVKFVCLSVRVLFLTILIRPDMLPHHGESAGRERRARAGGRKSAGELKSEGPRGMTGRPSGGALTPYERRAALKLLRKLVHDGPGA